MSKEALKLAIEALEQHHAPKVWPFAVKQDDRKAIEACRAALAALSDQDKRPVTVTMNGYQLVAALDFVAPDRDAEQMESAVRVGVVALTNDEGQQEPASLACCLDDYPEEGWISLPEDAAATTPAAPVAQG